MNPVCTRIGGCVCVCVGEGGGLYSESFPVCQKWAHLLRMTAREV